MDAVLPLAQRLDDRIDAVANDAEGVGRAPGDHVSTMMSEVFKSPSKSGAGCGV